jgi:uncharacterized damage-inducible protein DinB
VPYLIASLCRCAAALLLAAPVAQPVFKPSPNPVSDAVRQSHAQHSKHIVAAAELMPADKYGYKPTEPQMAFGQLMVHIVQTNTAICSAIGDLPADDVWKLAPTESKDVLVAAIKRSFTLCADALAKVTDASLGEEATMMGKRTGQSRALAMTTIVADWADHYSTAASYLRLNGLLPPSAQPKK